MAVDLKVFPPGNTKPTAMVVSHERSGTHFLINTLERAFGYASSLNRLDLDYSELSLNYHSPRSWKLVFEKMEGAPVASPIKSHHNADFVAPAIEDVLKGADIFYIYRHPKDVMSSFWRLLRSYDWREGPDCPTPADMMRAEPEGQMMRYQMVQYESLLHRWMAHVQGWMDLAERHERIHPVRYEDLHDNYAATVTKLGETAIGCPPDDLTPPDRTNAVVLPTTAQESAMEWSDADLNHIEEVASPLLERLGYL